MKTLGKPEAPIGAVADAVNELVGIAYTEADEDDAFGVGDPIMIGIAQVDELVEISHLEAACAGFEALHHGEPVGEARGFVSFAVAVDIFEDEDVVGAFGAGLGLGVGG